MPSTYKLDAVDLRILQALHNDGRMSNTRIAELAHLSESACLNRVRNLRKAGIITGCHAEIAIKKINPGSMTVFVIVKLESDKADDIHQFEQYIDGVPEVIAWHALLGEQDYLLQMVVPSLDKHRGIVADMMHKCPHVSQFTSHVTHRNRVKQMEVSSILGE